METQRAQGGGNSKCMQTAEALVEEAARRARPFLLRTISVAILEPPPRHLTNGKASKETESTSSACQSGQGNLAGTSDEKHI